MLLAYKHHYLSLIQMSHKTPSHYWRLLKNGLCFLIFGIGALTIATTILPTIAIFSCNKKIRNRRARYVLHLSWKFFVFVMSACDSIEVMIKKSERLKNLHSKIIVANHPSLIDIVILIAEIPQADCIVKGALARNFFMKNIVKSLYILNSHNFDSVLKQCAKSLESGNNLIVFPEATRSVPGQQSNISRGTAHIALNSDCDILPITIKCTPPALLKNQKWHELPNETLLYEIEAGELIKIDSYKNEKGGRPIAARHLTNTIKLALNLN